MDGSINGEGVSVSLNRGKLMQTLEPLLVLMFLVRVLVQDEIREIEAKTRIQTGNEHGDWLFLRARINYD